MRTYGRLLLVIGLLLMVGAFFFPVVTDIEGGSAPLANLDKIALRTMLEIAGAAVAIVGAIFATDSGSRSEPAVRRPPPPDLTN